MNENEKINHPNQKLWEIANQLREACEKYGYPKKCFCEEEEKDLE